MDIDPSETKRITLTCRFIPYDQWLLTHLQPTWKIKHVKSYLLHKCISTPFTPPPAAHEVAAAAWERPASPITFAPDPRRRPISPIKFAPPGRGRGGDTPNSIGTGGEGEGGSADGSAGREGEGEEGAGGGGYDEDDEPWESSDDCDFDSDYHGTVESHLTSGGLVARGAYQSSSLGHGHARSGSLSSSFGGTPLPAHQHHRARMLSGTGTSVSHGRNPTPNQKPALPQPQEYTLLRFSTGQLLEDEFQLKDYDLSPYELLELHTSTSRAYLCPFSHSHSNHRQATSRTTKTPQPTLHYLRTLTPLPRSQPQAYVQPYWEGWVRALRVVWRDEDAFALLGYTADPVTVGYYYSQQPIRNRVASTTAAAPTTMSMGSYATLGGASGMGAGFVQGEVVLESMNQMKDLGVDLGGGLRLKPGGLSARAGPNSNSGPGRGRGAGAAGGVAVAGGGGISVGGRTKLEWRERWVVIRDGVLSLCKDREDPNPTHRLPLSSLAALRGPEHLARTTGRSSTTSHQPSSSPEKSSRAGTKNDRTYVPTSREEADRAGLRIVCAKFRSPKNAAVGGEGTGTAGKEKGREAGLLPKHPRYRSTGPSLSEAHTQGKGVGKKAAQPAKDKGAVSGSGALVNDKPRERDLERDSKRKDWEKQLEERTALPQHQSLHSSQAQAPTVRPSPSTSGNKNRDAYIRKGTSSSYKGSGGSSTTVNHEHVRGGSSTTVNLGGSKSGSKLGSSKLGMGAFFGSNQGKKKKKSTPKKKPKTKVVEKGKGKATVLSRLDTDNDRDREHEDEDGTGEDDVGKLVSRVSYNYYERLTKKTDVGLVFAPPSDSSDYEAGYGDDGEEDEEKEKIREREEEDGEYDDDEDGSDQEIQFHRPSSSPSSRSASPLSELGEEAAASGHPAEADQDPDAEAELPPSSDSGSSMTLSSPVFAHTESGDSDSDDFRLGLPRVGYRYGYIDAGRLGEVKRGVSASASAASAATGTPASTNDVPTQEAEKSDSDADADNVEQRDDTTGRTETDVPKRMNSNSKGKEREKAKPDDERGEWIVLDLGDDNAYTSILRILHRQFPHPMSSSFVSGLPEIASPTPTPFPSPTSPHPPEPMPSWSTSTLPSQANEQSETVVASTSRLFSAEGEKEDSDGSSSISDRFRFHKPEHPSVLASLGTRQLGVPNKTFGALPYPEWRVELFRRAQKAAMGEVGDAMDLMCDFLYYTTGGDKKPEHWKTFYYQRRKQSTDSQTSTIMNSLAEGGSSSLNTEIAAAHDDLSEDIIGVSDSEDGEESSEAEWQGWMADLHRQSKVKAQRAAATRTLSQQDYQDSDGPESDHPPRTLAEDRLWFIDRQRRYEPSGIITTSFSTTPSSPGYADKHLHSSSPPSADSHHGHSFSQSAAPPPHLPRSSEAVVNRPLRQSVSMHAEQLRSEMPLAPARRPSMPVFSVEQTFSLAPGGGSGKMLRERAAVYTSGLASFQFPTPTEHSPESVSGTTALTSPAPPTHSVPSSSSLRKDTTDPLRSPAPSTLPKRSSSAGMNAVGPSASVGRSTSMLSKGGFLRKKDSDTEKQETRKLQRPKLSVATSSHHDLPKTDLRSPEIKSPTKMPSRSFLRRARSGSNLMSGGEDTMSPSEDPPSLPATRKQKGVLAQNMEKLVRSGVAALDSALDFVDGR